MTYPRPHSSSRRGFTLLELIISVALVLVLMLAVTRIFTITSNAVGASQGLSAATRDARAAQAVFARDIGAMANDTPFIWITSGSPTGSAMNWPVAAFRNADDAASDRDGNPLTRDLDENGTEGESAIPGEIVTAYDVNNRNHRLDRFSFCARDRFSRLTGNTAGGELVSPMTASEAWIYYGPLTLPNNDGSFLLTGSPTAKTEPGAGTAATNPNNFYASQWVLGRFAPLMVRPDATSGLIRYNGVSQEFYPRVNATTSLTPFDSNTVSNVSTTPKPVVGDARYDLIGVDIAQASQNLSDFGFGFGWSPNFIGSLFRVNPFLTKPISPASASQQVPNFVQGCSQFIVEFAGDFCTQDNDSTSSTYGVPATGTPTPDGIIDFAVVNGQRQIRWYGYPRDTDGTPGINLIPSGTNAVGGDVVTVSDFVLPAGANYAAVDTDPVPFEHATVNAGNAAVKTRKSYASTDASLRYVACWGPGMANRPKMYRITMVIDRPEMAGRTAEGARFEFVINAP